MSDDWQPAFEGQRPPFEPGNTAALRHGARSAAVVEPRAAALLEQVASDPSTSYLAQPAYAATLRAWARAQAKADLFGEWLEGQPLEKQLTPPRGGTRPPLDVWLSMLRTALAFADRLGLTPLSRGKLGRDVAVAESMSAALDRLAERGREALAGRDDEGSGDA